MSAVFEAGGVQVVQTCYDGLSLVEAIVKHQPSLVALDLVLSGLTGLQVIEAVHRNGLTPSFVVASMVSTRERVLAAKEAGVSYYVLKPIDASRLGEVLSRLTSQLALGKC